MTVTADRRADEASAVLRRHGAYDISNRASSGSTTRTAGVSTHAATTPMTGRDADTIAGKGRAAARGKQPVEMGQVTVRKEVHTENKTLEVPVQREEVVIERTPVHGREATEIAAGDIREGEQLRVPVREEQVKVGKETVVAEEVKVGKRVVQDTERVSGQVRKEEVKVEQTGDVDVKTRGKGKDTNPA